VEEFEMTTETEVVFPRALRDIYPAPAQQLYIETYKKSWAVTEESSRDNLSRESVAARDAWDAVGRLYTQDPVTHKFRRSGDQVAAEPSQMGRRTFLGTLKGLFKR
jgi:cation transport regulator ChaB